MLEKRPSTFWAPIAFLLGWGFAVLAVLSLLAAGFGNNRGGNFVGGLIFAVAAVALIKTGKLIVAQYRAMASKADGGGDGPSTRR